MGKPVNECAIGTSNEWKKVLWWLWCEERIGSWAERYWEGRQNLDRVTALMQRDRERQI